MRLVPLGDVLVGDGTWIVAGGLGYLGAGQHDDLRGADDCRKSDGAGCRRQQLAPRQPGNDRPGRRGQRKEST